jgi:hypothetical protein
MEREKAIARKGDKRGELEENRREIVLLMSKYV